jgi:hypothetical protein
MVEKNSTKKKKKMQSRKTMSYNYTHLFFLISSKEWKGKTKLRSAALRKKTCAKDIHPCPYHHHVYEIARFIDSCK